VQKDSLLAHHHGLSTARLHAEHTLHKDSKSNKIQTTLESEEIPAVKDGEKQQRTKDTKLHPVDRIQHIRAEEGRDPFRAERLLAERTDFRHYKETMKKKS
jgi:hypothetical protein